MLKQKKANAVEAPKKDEGNGTKGHTSERSKHGGRNTGTRSVMWWSDDGE
jgi:hypothetical protein